MSDDEYHDLDRKDSNAKTMTMTHDATDFNPSYVNTRPREQNRDIYDSERVVHVSRDNNLWS